MDNSTKNQFKATVATYREERARVRALVRAGRWKDAERVSVRFKAFAAKRSLRNPTHGAEAVQGDTLDFQPASFLVEGAVVRRAVAYVEVSSGTKSNLGTGFMVSPRLFITNQHVIQNAEDAVGALITFDREIDESGRPRPTTSFLLDPAAFALFSAEDELDYALVAVGTRQSGAATLSELGCCPLSDAGDKHVLGMSTNVIQHPGGMRKLISVRNNLLVARTDRTLLYESDTETGSSGAPVFNDDWDVVALHHYGEPFLERTDDQGNAIPVQVNEGVRISAIYGDLQRQLDGVPPAWRPLLEEALELGRRAASAAGIRPLAPPRPTAPAQPTPSPALVAGAQPPTPNIPIREVAATAATKEQTMAQSSNTRGLEFVVPLRISISIGSPESGEVVALAVPALTAPVLGRKAEAVRVDTDYANRKGYQPEFIPGVSVPVPKLTGNTANELAPLRAGESDADEGELRYQHFSVKMNRVRQMAIYTATNINGEDYLRVDRATGQVVGGAEGERWFRDPRISASFFLDQSFYSDWSTYFDRGHLTRRTDPTWGTEEEAERANADTFHFTNCSPQHFRFNQSARYWQGVERYILETGVLDQDSKRRLCVFQGPLFDDRIDRMADNVQIPSSFFKVVAWKSNSGLKSVGMVVDQGPLLDEPRRFLGQPQAVPHVNVNHWRVPIATIERRAGIDFGRAVRDADTIGRQQQPPAGGAEALQGHLITNFDQIVL